MKKPLQAYLRPEVQNFPNLDWGETKVDDSFLVLKWGEFPYSPLPEITEAIALAAQNINRYPTQMNSVKKALAQYANISEKQICLTNGTDKAFRLLAEIFICPGDEVITFVPSYPVIESAVQLMGGTMKKIPLTEGFLIPAVNDIKKQITAQTKCIYICNPNNPSGNFIATQNQIEELLNEDILVIVDEAYMEFSGKTVQSLLSKYQNLIILRSFSKTFGLAGCRVGYILSSPEICAQCKKIEETIEIFNISSLSLAAVGAALENQEKIAKLREKIKKTRQEMSAFLERRKFTVYPSETSFLLFDVSSLDMNSSDFVSTMRKEKILLKDCSLYEGLDQNKVYTAIPAESDLPRFTQAIEKLMLQSKKGTYV